MRSWVREMRPRTFVESIASMSLSFISPTRSMPWAPPALLTVATDSERRGTQGCSRIVSARKWKLKVGDELTEDVDVAEVLWYFRP